MRRPARHPVPGRRAAAACAPAVMIAAAEAEVVPGQHETVDLAAAVGQGAHQAQRPGGQCIDMVSLFAGAGQCAAHADLL
ncbi:hypothetical protein G6F50_017203 [Rhizopus delemar]|uniref:Uncharacterized protein n=1 Tax=Rhizopus delemar TaxID=936053 RepID=A0A9P7C0X0_9FUNG|nr:hypothetical protein G6F50_017203 [Rhizopus delemar]